MAILLREVIQEGVSLKWYMGVSWYDPLTNTVVAYPIPFNMVIRLLRNIYFMIAFPNRSKLEEYMQGALHQRWREGKEMGIVIGRNQIYDEINSEKKRRNEHLSNNSQQK